MMFSTTFSSSCCGSGSGGSSRTIAARGGSSSSSWLLLFVGQAVVAGMTAAITHALLTTTVQSMVVARRSSSSSDVEHRRRHSPRDDDIDENDGDSDRNDEEKEESTKNNRLSSSTSSSSAAAAARGGGVILLHTRLQNVWRQSLILWQDSYHQRLVPFLEQIRAKQQQLFLWSSSSPSSHPWWWQRKRGRPTHTRSSCPGIVCDAAAGSSGPAVATAAVTAAATTTTTAAVVVILGSMMMLRHYNNSNNSHPSVTRHSYRDPSTGYYHHQVQYRYPAPSSSSSVASAHRHHYSTAARYNNHLATWWFMTTAAAGWMLWSHFLVMAVGRTFSDDKSDDDDDDDPTRKWPRQQAAFPARTATTTPPTTTTSRSKHPHILRPKSHPPQDLMTEQQQDGEAESSSWSTATASQQQQQHQQHAKTTKQNTKTKINRYLEVLVHNVSHSDLILSLAMDDPAKITTPTQAETTTTAKLPDNHNSNHNNNNEPQSSDPYCLCRPRFSCFDMYTRLVLEALSSSSSPTAATGTTTTTTVAAAAGSSSNTTQQQQQQQRQQQPGIVWAPRYQRALDSPRLTIHKEPSDQFTPIGFQLLDAALSVSVEHIKADLRLRGRDQAKFEAAAVATTRRNSSNNANNKANAIDIDHVFFPLLATLLPRWHEHILEKQYHSASATVHRVLVLVTGVGTPRNYTHSLLGNSTQALADLLQVFLQRIDPTLQVVHIHSTLNIFRYDENLIFVERELVPAIAAYRDAHARGLPYPTAAAIKKLLQCPRTLADLQQQQYDGKNHHSMEREHPFDTGWHKTFAVTLSFADGSPARNHAIQACLRPYRPTYFHFWQLKTFWHEAKIVDDDIEVHSFQAMETDPPTEADRCTDPWIVAVVQEMRLFSQEMTQTLACSQKHDFDRFWLRKTHKPVLAVLLVQTPEMPEPVLYRGTNMEVSMPTGSLCAERNVIGSALAENPTLKREDLKLIAVLAVPEMDRNQKNANMPHVPSTSTIDDYFDQQHLRKGSIGSEQDPQQHNARRISFGSENDYRVGGGVGGNSNNINGSSSGRLNDNDAVAQEMDWVLPTDGDASVDQREQHQQAANSSFTLDEDMATTTTAAAAEQSNDTTFPHACTTTTTPLRRIPLFSKSTVALRQQQSSQHRRTVVVHSCNDLNPLKPCGACNEWLKKIAECNPYFRIITFTDANCNGIYVTPCQD